MSGRAQKISLAGAVVAALGASACCLGPVLLAAAGVGGVGAAAALGAYRPHLLAATTVLLAAGYYFAYRKPRHVASCGCERPRERRAGRIALWSATVAVAILAASPSLLAHLARSPAASAMPSNLPRAVFHIPGIDCEGCLGPMRKALAKVGGLHDVGLDTGQRTLTVTYEPAAGRVEAYAAAIRDLGYDVTWSEGSEP